MSARRLRIAVIATPVAPLGASPGGGVDYVARQLLRLAPAFGHHLVVLAPRGSRQRRGNPRVVALAGTLHTPAQNVTTPANVLMMPQDSVLIAAFDWVRKQQSQFDVVLNLAYDWYPYLVAPYLHIPVACYVSMSAQSGAFAQLIQTTAKKYPNRVAFASRAQAATFGLSKKIPILYGGVALSRYTFVAKAENVIGWAGRIAPEKGLETVFAVARRTGLPLRLIGKIDHQTYWRQIRRRFLRVRCDYRGFLPTVKLQRALGPCQVFIHAPALIEAFGISLLEALACGVPVVTYRDGGPKEIIRHGVNGYLVPRGDIGALVAAVQKIDRIDRRACRGSIEKNFTELQYAERLFTWLSEVAKQHSYNTRGVPNQDN